MNKLFNQIVYDWRVIWMNERMNSNLSPHFKFPLGSGLWVALRNTVAFPKFWRSTWTKALAPWPLFPALWEPSRAFRKVRPLWFSSLPSIKWGNKAPGFPKGLGGGAGVTGLQSAEVSGGSGLGLQHRVPGWNQDAHCLKIRSEGNARCSPHGILCRGEGFGEDPQGHGLQWCNAMKEVGASLGRRWVFCM